MSLGQSHRITDWVGPRSRRTLALVAALVWCIGVFVFFGEEAWAQQPVTVTGKERPVIHVPGVAEPAGTPRAGSGIETPLVEVPFAEVAPAGAAVPVGKPSAVLAGVGSAPLIDLPGPEPVPFYRYDPGAPVGPAPEPGMPRDLGLGPLPGPAVSMPATIGPVAFEKNEPLPLPVGEKPFARVPTMGMHPAHSPGGGTVGAVPVGYSPPATVRSAPVPFVPGSLPADLQPPLSPDTLTSADAPGRDAPPVPPSVETEDPSEGTLWPFSPFTPPGDSYFSLSSSGQAGLGGGVAPLLVCVLASGLILLRRDGPLRWWVSFEPPKPSSALLAPLERPG